jgi:hypothetical protein
VTLGGNQGRSGGAREDKNLLPAAGFELSLIDFTGWHFDYPLQAPEILVAPLLVFISKIMSSK